MMLRPYLIDFGLVQPWVKRIQLSSSCKKIILIYVSFDICPPFCRFGYVRMFQEVLREKSKVSPMLMLCAGYVFLVRMKEVREQEGCFLAKVVARSTTGTAWKVGLNIEVSYWFLLFLRQLRITMFSLMELFFRSLSLEFMDMPLLPNLWGNKTFGTRWILLLVLFLLKT